MTREKLLARQAELLEAAKARGGQMNEKEQTEFDVIQRLLDDESKKPSESSADKADDKDKDKGEGDARAVELAVQHERERVRRVTEICTAFGMDADKFVRDGSSVEQVNAAAVAQRMNEWAPLPAGSGVTEDEGDKFARSAAMGLSLRGGVQLTAEEADSGRRYASQSLREIAIECKRREGMSEASLRSMSLETLFAMLQRDFFSSTGMFPIILDSTIEKAVIEGYKEVPVSYEQITISTSLPDFKIHDNDWVASEVGDFEEVPEGGEIKEDSYQFAKRPQRQLKKYGKSFSYTYEMFVNDDVGVISAVPKKYAAAKERTVNNQVYGALLGNAPIYDGLPLFSAQHGNVLSKGTGMTADGLQSMMALFTNQKNDFGKDIDARANIPTIMLLPMNMELDTRRLFNSQYLPTDSNALAENPFRELKGTFKVIEDQTINVLAQQMGIDVPWFLLSALSNVPWCEVIWLDGDKRLHDRKMEKPGQLGFHWDFWYACAVHVRDYRGIAKNPGTQLTVPIPPEGVEANS